MTNGLPLSFARVAYIKCVFTDFKIRNSIDNGNEHRREYFVKIVALDGPYASAKNVDEDSDGVPD